MKIVSTHATKYELVEVSFDFSFASGGEIGRSHSHYFRRFVSYGGAFWEEVEINGNTKYVHSHDLMECLNMAYKNYQREKGKTDDPRSRA